jgi:hypothetical protein
MARPRGLAAAARLHATLLPQGWLRAAAAAAAACCLLQQPCCLLALWIERTVTVRSTLAVDHAERT